MTIPLVSSTKQILYVDDEPQAVKYFGMLYGKQFEIATAGSADEAFAYIGNHANEVGVLVTDQRMPGKSGVELMELVRYRHPNIVRVLITAFSELDSAIKAVNEGGAFRYLTKPVNENEMIGTLLRALEHHMALEIRDQLMREKLNVLHRLIVMDRIRGLATAATALEGRVQNAWPALVAYMQQSPVRQRIRIQMDEIAGMNMIAVARREAELMVRTVEIILSDTVYASSGINESIAISNFLSEFVQDSQSMLQEDDIELSLIDSQSNITMQVDQGMLYRALNITVRRIADMQDQPTKIELRLRQEDVKHLIIEVIGGFGGMSNGHVASLFAAAIPLQKWPIGLDMDLLSAFMIVHHLGGELDVLPDPPDGPGLRMTLPIQPTVFQRQAFNPNWFDTVYESLEEWENDVVNSLVD